MGMFGSWRAFDDRGMHRKYDEMFATISRAFIYSADIIKETKKENEYGSISY